MVWVVIILWITSPFGHVDEALRFIGGHLLNVNQTVTVTKHNSTFFFMQSPNDALLTRKNGMNNSGEWTTIRSSSSDQTFTTHCLCQCLEKSRTISMASMQFLLLCYNSDNSLISRVNSSFYSHTWIQKIFSTSTNVASA